jgi:hypothetical protein
VPVDGGFLFKLVVPVGSSGTMFYRLGR